jgi:hypothetical protein
VILITVTEPAPYCSLTTYRVLSVGRNLGPIWIIIHCDGGADDLAGTNLEHDYLVCRGVCRGVIVVRYIKVLSVLGHRGLTQLIARVHARYG